MSRSRSLAGVLLLALTLGFTVVGASSSSSADSFHAVIPKYAVGHSRIQGTVESDGGKLLDNVLVTATGEGDASQLTYGKDGGPDHGYFNLSVTKGTYSVTFSKDGYTSVTKSGVSVARRSVTSLGSVTLQKKAVNTKTSAKLIDDSIKASEKGKVKVTVTPGREKPVGNVTVKEGKEVVGSGSLEGSDRGELIVTLMRLPAGSHDLKVFYKGTKAFAPSSSDEFTLKVRRRR